MERSPLTAFGGAATAVRAGHVIVLVAAVLDAIE
jgi:hypothetical protein